MPELNVQQKVIAFVQRNPQYEGKSAESVLSAMLASGEITQIEIDRLKTSNTKSAFGFGFETDYFLDMSECPDWFLELADKYNLPIVLK